MNPTDFALERLFQAARRARSELSVEVPYRLENGVLGAWRRGRRAEEPGPVLPLVRKAFLGACAILVIAAFLGLHSWREAPAAVDELAIVDSAIQLSLMQ
jgi:hypothetical protein